MLKNITFSANASLIEKARKKAREQNKPLNVLFREWLLQLTGGRGSIGTYDEIMKSLHYVSPGRKKFSRDEMNER